MTPLSKLAQLHRTHIDQISSFRNHKKAVASKPRPTQSPERQPAMEDTSYSHLLLKQAQKQYYQRLVFDFEKLPQLATNREKHLQNLENTANYTVFSKYIEYFKNTRYTEEKPTFNPRSLQKSYAKIRNRVMIHQQSLSQLHANQPMTPNAFFQQSRSINPIKKQDSFSTSTNAQRQKTGPSFLYQNNMIDFAGVVK